jgi:hypothetical protein
MILPISDSSVPGIIGMSHHALLKKDKKSLSKLLSLVFLII